MVRRRDDVDCRLRSGVIEEGYVSSTTNVLDLPTAGAARENESLSMRLLRYRAAVADASNREITPRTSALFASCSVEGVDTNASC